MRLPQLSRFRKLGIDAVGAPLLASFARSGNRHTLFAKPQDSRTRNPHLPATSVTAFTSNSSDNPNQMLTRSLTIGKIHGNWSNSRRSNILGVNSFDTIFWPDWIRSRLQQPP